MATGGFVEQREEFKDQDSRYICGLCFEPYRGRTPKLLPCSHTFCLPCLTTLEAAVNAAQPEAGEEQDKGSDVAKGSGEKETAEQHDSSGQASDVRVDADDVTVRGRSVGRKMIPSPSCRTAFSIPEGGVAALQTNFCVDHEESADEAPPPVLCDMWDDGHQQYATHVCRQCPRKRCGSCRRCHDKLLPTHHVTVLGLCQPQEKDERKGLCLIHRDQPLCFHCRQCDVTICLHCKLTSHDGHKTVDLASACLKAKEEVMSLMTTAQQQVQTVDTAMRSVDHQERRLTLHVQNVTQEIKARTDVLVTQVQQSRDQLLEEVKVKEDAVKSQLCSEKMSMTVTKDTLTALVSRALHTTGGDPDVLVLRKELGLALLSEDKLDLYQQLAARQEPVWKWRYDVTDASVIQPDDVKAYVGRVVEGADADVTKSVSLRELDAKVTNMMAQLATVQTDLEQKTTSLTDDISSMRNKLEKTRELFRVGCLNQYVTKLRNPMVFRNIYLNADDCYNNMTGIFTAPETGTYHFTATVKSCQSYSVRATIRVNYNKYTTVRGGSYPGSGCMLVPLTAGQTVCLEADRVVEDYHEGGCSFSGSLVQAAL